MTGHGLITLSFPACKRALSACPPAVINAVTGIDDSHVSDADMDVNHDDDDDNADDVIADDTTTRDDADCSTKLS